MIYDIINEINESNSSNHKMKVLKKHEDNKLLKRVLKMAYDRVSFTYGVSMKNVKIGPSEKPVQSLDWALDYVEAELVTRETTGKAAINLLELIFTSLNANDQIVLKRIIDRDLRINMGRSNINKVFKNLITKSIYMRCGIYTTDKIVNGKLKKGTARKISFPAYINLKADGTYRETSKIDNVIEFTSRSGEPYTYPELADAINKANFNGYLTGELTVIADDEIMTRILPKIIKEDVKNGTDVAEKLKKRYETAKKTKKEFILPRSIGNGLINSSEVPHNNLVYEVWDYITPEDYTAASKKDKKNPPLIKYKDRFKALESIIKKINNEKIRVIEHRVVKSLKEATDFTSKKMHEGLEGAILKDFDMLFKDGTSDGQLKMKIAFQLDVRVTGFIEGKKGTKREETFGSMTYETDDGMIKGSVSGFNDEDLKNFNSRRKELIGSVIEIEGNDLTQGRGNTHYAVSHPRFIELRNDKKTTDDIERAKLMLESAKEFK